MELWGKIMEKRYKLINGDEYLLREIEIKDAAMLIKYVKIIIEDTNNLTFSPGEFNPTIEQETNYIESKISSKNNLELVAIYDNTIIANLSVISSTTKKTKHSCEFSIAVLKEYWQNKIASKLIEVMIEWSIDFGISKINLKVKEDNTSAISLYEKYGFTQEGIISKEFLIDGKYYNALIMGLEI